MVQGGEPGTSNVDRSAMTAKDSYRSEMSRKYIEKYNELRRLLPGLCDSYLNNKGIHCKTDTLVMTCRDLLEFFKWLVAANPMLAGKEPKDLTLSDLSGLTYEDINEFQTYRLHVLENKPSRVARLMSTLRTFFKYEAVHGFLNSDPTSGSASVRIPQNKTIIRLNAEEVARLILAVENSYGTNTRMQKMQKKNRYRDTAIIVLLLNTGIRISELVGLNIDDVDIESDEPSIYVIRKGGGSDQVYLNSNTVEALSDYINLERDQYISADDNTTALFLSNRSRRFTVRSVQKMVEKYVAIALPQRSDVHVHTFRKTYGTRLYDITGDIKMVQDVLGHSDPSTTSRYYIGSDHKKEAKDINPY